MQARVKALGTRICFDGSSAPTLRVDFEIQLQLAVLADRILEFHRAQNTTRGRPDFGPNPPAPRDAVSSRVIVVMEFCRSPNSFRKCLDEEATLAACTHTLQAAGLRLPGKGKANICVSPEEFLEVRARLDGASVAFSDGSFVPRFEDLEARHIVMNASMAPHVLSAIDDMRGATGAKCRTKERVVLKRGGRAELDLDSPTT